MLILGSIDWGKVFDKGATVVVTGLFLSAFQVFKPYMTPERFKAAFKSRAFRQALEVVKISCTVISEFIVWAMMLLVALARFSTMNDMKVIFVVASTIVLPRYFFILLGVAIGPLRSKIAAMENNNDGSTEDLEITRRRYYKASWKLTYEFWSTSILLLVCAYRIMIALKIN